LNNFASNVSNAAATSGIKVHKVKLFSPDPIVKDEIPATTGYGFNRSATVHTDCGIEATSAAPDYFLGEKNNYDYSHMINNYGSFGNYSGMGTNFYGGGGNEIKNKSNTKIISLEDLTTANKPDYSKRYEESKNYGNFTSFGSANTPASNTHYGGGNQYSDQPQSGILTSLDKPSPNFNKMSDFSGAQSGIATGDKPPVMSNPSSNRPTKTNMPNVNDKNSNTRAPNPPPRFSKSSKYTAQVMNDFDKVNLQSSKYQSNLSQPQVDSTGNNFKIPTSHQSSNYFKKEFMRARNSIRSSTDSLRRLQLRDSINNIKINSSTGMYNASGLKDVDMVKIDNLIHFPVEYMKLFFGAAGFAAATFCVYKAALPLIENVNLVDVGENYKQIAVGIAAFLITIYVVHLIKKNKELKLKAKKLTADNIVQGIKQHLQEKRDVDGIDEPEILVEIFIESYCSANDTTVDDFKKNTLPYMREIISEDDQLNEVNTYSDGVLKTFWRLQ
jgi:hypothetical protein